MSAAPHPPMRSSSVLWRLFAFVRPFYKETALSALLAVLTIGSSIGLMAASAFILARASQHPSIADLAVAIVGVRFFGIARGAFRYLERLVSHYVNLSLLANLRVWFYQSIEPLSPARWLQSGHHSGDVFTRIVSDIETLQNWIVRIILPPLVAVGIALLMAPYLSAFSARLAWVTLGFMLLAGVALPWLVRTIARSTNQRLISVRAELNVALLDTVQGMADLLANGRDQVQLERTTGLANEIIASQSRMAVLGGMHTAVGGLFAHLAMWSVLLLAIPMVSTGLSPVYLGVLALAVLASFEGVLALPAGMQYLDSSLQAGGRLVELADEPSRYDMSQRHVISAPRAQLDLRVRDLTFRYAPDLPPALDRVAFDAPAGSSLAIVGPSGAGKSTLANLLLRFWDYDAGSITLGERELKAVPPDEVRSYFGVVSQTTHLFNATIRDNLLLARPGATDADIERAAEMAQLGEFISALPEGYRTRVGEQGLVLSGGERQRLALARALLQDAPILLLDEPTANLDPQTERAMLETLFSLRGDKTLLWITHRLTELERVDEIVVLDRGRIAEQGRHDELMQLDGLYRRMWQMQREILVPAI